MCTRAIIAINGIVQGVGFRPFVHQRARLHGLRGWVLNCPEGVRLEVEGPGDDVARFVDDLRTQPPVLAMIERVEVEQAEPVGYQRFEIRASDPGAPEEALRFISPDVATCPDCLRELHDPEDRRHHYPFTNCTNCGPRFTIIEDTPYDRDKTTMAPFVMCEACQAEYTDIEDRRYHAQPNACWRCGPQLRLEATGGTVCGEAVIARAQGLLHAGAILAVKGLGGFHLACDAEHEGAVCRLRDQKGREEKPLAIMCGSPATVEQLCEVSESERRLLTDPRRPIVLLRKRPDCPIAEPVAPGNRYLGVMLPYTPLHDLLFDGAPYRALVMTSGNLSEEPLVKSNAEARQLLRRMADGLILHNREIHARCDDSVARVVAGRASLVRRSRGYAPFPIRLGPPGPTILACGAELKNTFCLVHQGYAFLSQHIGDLKNAKAIECFEEEIEHYQQLFRAEPSIIVHDLHPQYLSTQYALQHPCATKVAVQHHHAHIVSCMAEHGLDEEVIGVSFDGLGLGDDGHVWGGEFLVCTRAGYRRAGHLQYVPMPGGDAAVREPWRMALAYLNRGFDDAATDAEDLIAYAATEQARNVVRQMVHTGFNAPLTSSCGRLFDAVAALLGLRGHVTFEGQAAMELEQHAATARPLDAAEGVAGQYDYGLWEPADVAGRLLVDAGPVIRGVVDDVRGGTDTHVVAGRFHNTVAAFVLEVVERIAAPTGLDKVVLSGGCFQNALLVGSLLEGLQERELTPYVHHLVPPNDGGLALGQAAAAEARWKRGYMREAQGALRDPGAHIRNPKSEITTMCLGVPAEVVELKASGRAIVSIAGARREAYVDLVPDVQVGDYVILHAGFAIQRLDAEAAEETLALLRAGGFAV